MLGQDGQQILVKHGSYYIRVHPCRAMFFSDENNHTLANGKADTRVNGEDISKYQQDNSVLEKDVTVESDDDNFAKVSDTQQEMQPEHTTKQNQQNESSTLSSTTGDYIDHPDSLHQEVKVMDF